MKVMKYLISFCLIFVLMFSLTGCSSKKEEVENNTPVANENVISSEKENTNEVNETNEVANPVLVNVTYYHADENVEKIISDKAEIKECNAQALMDLLLEKKVISEKVTVNSFDQGTDGKLKLDLSKNFETMVSNKGTTGETMIIGSVVNTMLTNLNGKTIKITVDGKDIATGHDIYDYEFEFFK